MKLKQDKLDPARAIVCRVADADLTPSADQSVAAPEGLLPSRVTPDRTIVIPDAEPPLDLFLNGRPMVQPFAEARRLFHACVYGWLLPLDMYRWNVDGHSGTVLICNTVPRASRRFALLMHTRGTRKLTQEALGQIENVEEMSKDVFQARAARFNVIFGDMSDKLRPFFYYDFQDLRGLAHPAYQMHSSRDYIVVTGPADNTPEETVDWECFLRPPTPSGAQEAGQHPQSNG